MFYTYIFLALTLLIFGVATVYRREMGMIIAMLLGMVSVPIAYSVNGDIAYQNAMAGAAEEIASGLPWHNSPPVLKLEGSPLCQHGGEVRDGRLTSAQFKKVKEACALGAVMFKEASRPRPGRSRGIP